MRPEPSVAEVRRHFVAAPDRVFAAFADPLLVRRWLTPSPEIELEISWFDFRVGGTYRFAYHVPGGPVMIVGGTFRAIERPRRIVFSWIIEPPDEHAGIPSEVNVTIAPHHDGTQLVIRHEKFTRPDAVERHAAGWNGAMEQMTALLEAS